MLNTFGLGGSGLLIKDELFDDVVIDVEFSDIYIDIESSNDEITIEINNNC